MTDCIVWLNGVGLASPLPASSCARVPCPTTYNALVPGTASAGGPATDGTCPVGVLPRDGTPVGPLNATEFYSLLAEYALWAHEASAGWMWWNFQSELDDPRWGLLSAIEHGWLPADLSEFSPRRPPSCDDAFAGLGSNVGQVSLILAGCVGCSLALVLVVYAGCCWCRSKRQAVQVTQRTVRITDAEFGD